MTTPPLLRRLLLEFEKEMQEHGEPKVVQLRFYAYLQTALQRAEEQTQRFDALDGKQ